MAFGFSVSYTSAKEQQSLRVGVPGITGSPQKYGHGQYDTLARQSQAFSQIVFAELSACHLARSAVE